jgi:hypothetical protein
MAIGPLFSLASGFVESLFAKPPLSGTSPASPASTNSASTNGTATGGTQDTNQLSPFAQVLSSLQQLQLSNPSQYQQVTQQISTNLQTAAQSATTSGDTSLANQLTQLSTDFSGASTSGQLPNVQDLAQAIGGGHHHHYHFHAGASTGNPASSTAGNSSTAAEGLSQLIQALNPSQTGSIANNSLNPLSIIDTTLSNSGVKVGG